MSSVVRALRLLLLASFAACGGKTMLDSSADTSAPSGVDGPRSSSPSPSSPSKPSSPAPAPTPNDDGPKPGGAKDAGASNPCAPPSANAVGPVDAAAPNAATTCGASDAKRGSYLVSRSASFYSFDSTTRTATKLGVLACPAAPNTEPFTMTVAGDDAYVLYSDGDLFRVALDGLACTKTAFVQNQLGFPSNIAIATPTDAPGTGMFVYGCTSGACGCRPTLARSDLTTFGLVSVGAIEPLPLAGYPVDMKADAYGRVFALDAAGTLLTIDAATAKLLGRDETGVMAGTALAVLTWNDALFFFTQLDGRIHTYDLSSHQASQVGTIGDEIVGAGSAPCLH